MKSIYKILLLASSILFSSAVYAQKDPCLQGILLAEIPFQKKSVFLSNKSKSILDSTLLKINKKPTCKIVVISFDNSCEACQQIAWDRTFSVVKYLKQKGVDSSRIVFIYAADDGDPLLVTLRGAADGEDGPNIIPAPHPCYSYHHLTKKRCKNLHH